MLFFRGPFQDGAGDERVSQFYWRKMFIALTLRKGHLQSVTVSEAAVDARSGTGLRICFLLWFPFRFSKERGRIGESRSVSHVLVAGL